MKTSARKKATVTVFQHEDGIEIGCAKCNKVIDRGQFVIGLEIGIERYVIGKNPPKICCGEEKKVPLLFTNVIEAERAKCEITAILNRDHDTSKLRLLKMAKVILPTIH